MPPDDPSDFRIRPGRVRDRTGRPARRTLSFVDQVMRAAANANGGPLTHAQITGRRRGSRTGTGKCSRIGRGQAAADALKRQASERGSGQRQRRVVIKARIVRHSFRFIVAPEDSDRLADLRGFTRGVMRQMETDLATRLDWVAVDHHNTGHPHSHVVIRGKDDLGKDLIIAQDYITDGVPLRAPERATLELRPETDIELRDKLRAEITAERFTRLDRAMIAEAEDGLLDLRPEAGQVQADFDRTLRLGRVQTLERLELATVVEPGLWMLPEDLELRLRDLGERGDIIKAIHRAMAERGVTRPPDAIIIDATRGDHPVVGRVIGKRLVDELGDRIGLVIDGANGRVHHIEIGGEIASDIRIGSIVEAGRRPDSRLTDRAIAELSRLGGEYRPGLHRALVESGDVRLPPGADPQAFVESHVRRLEALRRAGIVERISSERWTIPPDFPERASAYEAQRGNQARLRILSAYDLDRQITSDGATWLNRQMLGSQRVARVSFGFGADLDGALDARQEGRGRSGSLQASGPEHQTGAPMEKRARPVFSECPSVSDPR